MENTQGMIALSLSCCCHDITLFYLLNVNNNLFVPFVFASGCLYHTSDYRWRLILKNTLQLSLSPGKLTLLQNKQSKVGDDQTCIAHVNNTENNSVWNCQGLALICSIYMAVAH